MGNWVIINSRMKSVLSKSSNKIIVIFRFELTLNVFFQATKIRMEIGTWIIYLRSFQFIMSHTKTPTAQFICGKNMKRKKNHSHLSSVHFSEFNWRRHEVKDFYCRIWTTLHSQMHCRCANERQIILCKAVKFT